MEACSKIRFNAFDDVREFVVAAEKCDFDIDISYNRFIVDAKSILGVLSLDLSQILNVKCYGDNPEFARTLRKFAIA